LIFTDNDETPNHTNLIEKDNLSTISGLIQEIDYTSVNQDLRLRLDMI